MPGNGYNLRFYYNSIDRLGHLSMFSVIVGAKIWSSTRYSGGATNDILDKGNWISVSEI